MVSTVLDTETGESKEFDLHSAFECFECVRWVEQQRANYGIQKSSQVEV
jgi:hypothetical protein